MSKFKRKVCLEMPWQEIIDMCDFAAGLSRQINGSVIPSERKDR